MDTESYCNIPFQEYVKSITKGRSIQKLFARNITPFQTNFVMKLVTGTTRIVNYIVGMKSLKEGVSKRGLLH